MIRAICIQLQQTEGSEVVGVPVNLPCDVVILDVREVTAKSTQT